jgi:hypothetical protein
MVCFVSGLYNVKRIQVLVINLTVYLFPWFEFKPCDHATTKRSETKGDYKPLYICTVLRFYLRKRELRILRVSNVRAVSFSVHVKRQSIFIHKLRNLWLPIYWLLFRLQCLNFISFRAWGIGGCVRTLLRNLTSIFLEKSTGVKSGDRWGHSVYLSLSLHAPV